MIKKHFYNWTDVENMCVQIVTDMYTSGYQPDYIVGITRGGNVPATIISNMTGIPCEALKVSLRDDNRDSESNCWMAEEAFGHNNESSTGITGSRWDLSLRKKILIVDDINDTGATFNWIKKDWESGCYPDNESWNTVWGETVKFAVLTENLASEFDHTNFYAHEINKAEDDVWLVYPWEAVGKYE
jgi:hypoxanthine phosphoribosyltransferase|tara:strand:- start:204 stop:761 length:558 start_codon:yes stop_codon:yes gene_type:complete